MGPPNDVPNKFRINFWRGTPERLLKKLLALVSVLRWNSYSEPWKMFVPPLVTSAICAPEPRP